jgi:hypothetical protein
MPTSSTRLRAYLGMGVAKLKLDVVLLLEERHTHRIFANTAEGFAALHAWIQEQGDFELSVCLESTGAIRTPVSAFCWLRATMEACTIVPPWSGIGRPKTCGAKRTKEMRPCWRATARTSNQLPGFPSPMRSWACATCSPTAMSRSRTCVQERTRVIAGRLDASLVKLITDHVSWLAERRKGVEHSIKQLLEQSADPKTPWERLQTILSFGWYAAASFIAHLGASGRFTRVAAVVS